MVFIATQKNMVIAIGALERAIAMLVTLELTVACVLLPITQWGVDVIQNDRALALPQENVVVLGHAIIGLACVNAIQAWLQTARFLSAKTLIRYASNAPIPVA